MEGPEFLKTDEASWPVKLPRLDAMTDSADMEREKEQIHHRSNPDATRENDKFLDPSRLSSLTKLIYVTA